MLTLAFGAAHAATINTYYGGFEDTTKSNSGDFDYNDIVYSLSADGLTLNTAGVWHAPTPALGTSGTPFWNNASLDGANYNIGYCIYGGTPGNLSNCGTNKYGPDTVPSTGLAPADYYLTGSSPTTTANDVYFTLTGGATVTFTDYAEIAAGQDLIGYYLESSPSVVHYLNPGGTTGVFTFAPTGAFGLVATNGTDVYHSETALGNSTDASTLSHFAFFGPNPGGTVGGGAPEPSTMILAGGALALLLGVRRRM